MMSSEDEHDVPAGPKIFQRPKTALLVTQKNGGCGYRGFSPSPENFRFKNYTPLCPDEKEEKNHAKLASTSSTFPKVEIFNCCGFLFFSRSSKRKKNIII